MKKTIYFNLIFANKLNTIIINLLKNYKPFSNDLLMIVWNLNKKNNKNNKEIHINDSVPPQKTLINN